MINWTLIDEAVKLVIEIEEAEGVTEQTSTIQARALDWCNNTEITSAEMLAAATLNGSYNPSISWDTLEQWTDFYFLPEEACWEANHFSVVEIEEPYRDADWR